MAMRKVPLYQKPLTFTMVEEGATRGATVGLNLFWPDGSRVTENELRQDSADGTIEVLGLMSVQVVPTASDQYAVQLVGDLQSPGNSHYYGTSDAGAKGWHVLPDQPPSMLPIVTGEIVSGQPVFVIGPNGSLIYGPVP